MLERLSFGTPIAQVSGNVQRQFVKRNRLVALFQRFIRAPQTGKRTHFVAPIPGFAREQQILLIELYDLMHAVSIFSWKLGLKRAKSITAVIRRNQAPPTPGAHPARFCK